MHAQCKLCKRAVVVEGTKAVQKLKREGWTMCEMHNFHCPKCRRDNSDKSYWVKRDIREATSNEIAPIFNAPAIIRYLPQRRVG